MCNGTVFALSDQDDIWLPRKLEILAETLQGDANAAYVFSDAEIIQEQGIPLGWGLWEVREFSPEDPSTSFATRQFELLLSSNVVTGCAMAFRASFRDFLLPIPAHWIHDYWIALVGSSVAHGIAVPDRLLRYRRHTLQHIGAGRTTLFTRFKDSVRAQRGEYWEKLAAAQELRERVRHIAESFPVPQQYLDQIDEKASHLGARAAIQEGNSRSIRHDKAAFGLWGIAFRKIWTFFVTVERPTGPLSSVSIELKSAFAF
jgi:hypothetical protein